jgi:hypothetical protein
MSREAEVQAYLERRKNFSGWINAIRTGGQWGIRYPDGRTKIKYYSDYTQAKREELAADKQKELRRQDEAFFIGQAQQDRQQFEALKSQRDEIISTNRAAVEAQFAPAYAIRKDEWQAAIARSTSVDELKEIYAKGDPGLRMAARAMGLDPIVAKYRGKPGLGSLDKQYQRDRVTDFEDDHSKEISRQMKHVYDGIVATTAAARSVAREESGIFAVFTAGGDSMVRQLENTQYEMAGHLNEIGQVKSFADTAAEEPMSFGG